jgi:hypothetical protein
VSHIRRTGARGACAALIALVAFGATPASARPSAEVLLSALSSPKPLAIGLDGDPIVGQGTFGPPGPILRYILKGPNRGETVELLDEASLVDITETPDGAGWGIGTDGMLYRQAPDGSVDAVLDIIAYQEGDPDPVDQDDFPEESNPYGLTALPSSDVLFADAANNDLVRVTPDGDATTVARFDLEEISTDHLGGGFPPTLTAEAVPTSVTIGPDGAAYVGELKGFPFRPGSSHVWRVDPDENGAWCSVRTPESDCTVYASGLTAINDIDFNQHTGKLYVYELAAGGVLPFEEGFETGDFPPAVLLEVKKHKRTELAAGALSQPGGVAVADDGTIFVTDGMFSDGRLLRIHA